MTMILGRWPDARRAEAPAVLDVRTAVEFERLHAFAAVNIPSDELPSRIHELPPAHRPLTVYHTDARAARWACSWLRSRGRYLVEAKSDEAWLQSGPTATGASLDRLWQPHELLIEAARRNAEIWRNVHGRRALDIACGTGRDTVYLALLGFDVEAWDNLPDALIRVEDLAHRNGVHIKTECRDVEADFGQPRDNFDLVCVFNFLHRPLMPALAECVRPGGLIVYETFVYPQRELFGKPAREAHLLQSRELRRWFQGWSILVFREGLAGPGRFAASLIARRPADENVAEV